MIGYDVFSSTYGTKTYMAESRPIRKLIAQSLWPSNYTFNTTGNIRPTRSISTQIVYSLPIVVLYQTMDFGSDNVKVTQNSIFFISTRRGVDVVVHNGAVSICVQMNYTVDNFPQTASALKTL